ncbi:hypothetical protein DPEC_G00185630 [Dallia pectoralis]|uniref:Uncharacterized protein n=1 Tax=Dallia pectoralis TaxID=75939 RepID=A0ACC2GB81_DALPE|nr:hypothetical protein DPEC_G00185630 [Dallia pectoralis]
MIERDRWACPYRTILGFNSVPGVRSPFLSSFTGRCMSIRGGNGRELSSGRKTLAIFVRPHHFLTRPEHSVMTPADSEAWVAYMGPYRTIICYQQPEDLLLFISQRCAATAITRTSEVIIVTLARFPAGSAERDLSRLSPL